LMTLADEYEAEVRGRGMIQGIQFEDKSAAENISKRCFENGLIIETAGPEGEVLKTLPPLTISSESLERGLEILLDCAHGELGDAPHRSASTSATSN